MKYLLDISVINDFVQGEPHTLKRLKKASPSEFAIASITVAEMEYRFILNPQVPTPVKAVLKDFINAITTLHFDREDALCAANANAWLKQKGGPMTGYEILLAGTAMNHNLTIITSNMVEFIKIKDLKIENWRLA